MSFQCGVHVFLNNKNKGNLFKFFVVLLFLSGCSQAAKKSEVTTPKPQAGGPNIEISGTDYVIMLDVSQSMNDSEGQPTLSRIKNDLLVQMNMSWGMNSENQDSPGRVYFFPFAKGVRPMRQFELTNSGAQEFKDYLSRLEADGYGSAIIDTLEEVLATVPKISQSNNRPTRLQYILITDGDETEQKDWLNEKLLKSTLEQWSKDLTVDQRADQLLIVNALCVDNYLGFLRNWRNFEEIMKQGNDSGAPVTVFSDTGVIID